MKKILLVVLTVFLSIGVVGCQKSSTDKTDIEVKPHQTTELNQDNKNNKTIAYVYKTLTSPFFLEMQKGVKMAAQELGIEIITKSCEDETQIEKQIAIVEDLIASKVDAIVITPLSSTELVVPLKKAQDAGIKIVVVDTKLDNEEVKKVGLNCVTISVDNIKGAEMGAKYLAELVNGPTEAIIVQGNPNAENSNARAKGALNIFSKYENIKVVANAAAGWDMQEAYELSKKVFSQNPDIKIVFAANDQMALGISQYLEENKKTGVLICGYDASAEALTAIRDGKITASIDQAPAKQGYEGVKSALELVNGKTLPETVFVDLVVKHKGNID